MPLVDEERVLICVDDGARRRLFRAALSGVPGLEIVGTVEASAAAVRAAAARQPDLVLLEASRPGVEGAKLVGRLRSVAPQAGLISVAAPGDRPRSIAARSLTADRYVDVDISLPELVDVVAEYARVRRAERDAS